MGRSSRKTGANSHEDRLLDAVGAIYEAALSPGLWPDALSRASRLCGARWMIFSANTLQPFGTKVTVQNPEGDPELLARMIGRFTMPENNPSIPRMLASAPGRVILREEQFTDREWERTELYQETYRPFGLYGAFAVPLLKTPQYFVPLGVGRTRSRGGFEARDFLAVSRLVPHLQRAMQIMLRLDTLGLRASAMQEAWDRLPCGLVMLDAAGRILWSNRAAEAILAGSDGISARAGALHAGTNSASAELDRLIGEAARTGAAGGLHAGGALLLPRRPPARPLSVQVVPFRGHDGDAFMFGIPPAVMVFIADPDRPRELPEDALIRLYRLTRAEAAVAARIVAGTSLKRAAGDLGIATTTARLHLQRVLNKTGTHRQSELVRLLLTAVPPGF